MLYRRLHPAYARYYNPGCPAGQEQCGTTYQGGPICCPSPPSGSPHGDPELAEHYESVQSRPMVPGLAQPPVPTVPTGTDLQGCVDYAKEYCAKFQPDTQVKCLATLGFACLRQATDKSQSGPSQPMHPDIHAVLQGAAVPTIPKRVRRAIRRAAAGAY